MAVESLQDKIEKLKGRLAHKHPNLSLGELFDKLCDLGLETWDPGQKPPRKSKVIGREKAAAIAEDNNGEEKFSALRKNEALNVQAVEITVMKKSQAQIRREVFQKAQNRCEYCQSTFALEIDHIRPKALGGDDSPENLRLLCRCCNQRSAIMALSADKMERYL